MSGEFYNNKHDWQQISDIWENYCSIGNVDIKTSAIKQLAAEYLDTDISKKLSRQEFRALLAKADKMKTSVKKEERAKGQELAKQIQRAFNLYK
jgi:hypothetical protein